jgi:serine/threonine-protein kinase PknG
VAVDRWSFTEALPEPGRWLVRVRDADGVVLGAGILLGERHVLTCAHLLRSDTHYLGIEVAPHIDVVIDFVGSRPVASGTARVATGGWAPPDDGDVVLLELEEPKVIGSTTPLRRLPLTLDRAVRICGFPSGLEDGLWIDATLSGHGGPGREWVQMNATWAGRQVQAGFSGAPVFDKVTHGVIGMVVGKYTDEAAAISWMLPVETIARRLPRVTEWVSGARATDPSLAGDLESQRLDDDLARKVVSWIERHRETDNIQIIITGSPDSSGSITLRRAISLADREQRPSSSDPRLTHSPEGTIPPPGGIDLAVDATGKTPAEVFQRIADRTGILVDQSTEPTSELLDNLPPMNIIVYGIDDSAQPEVLLAEVLEPLAKRGHWLLLAFRRQFSRSLRIARSSFKTWMCAGLVPLPVLDFQDPATRVLANPTFFEPPKLAKGDLVANQYEVVGCLARGGLGWVYLAKDTHLDGNYVALKGQITKDVQSVVREITERRFLATLDHPNIVRIFNFVTHPEPHSTDLTGYIVMEYVGGQSLGEMRDIAAKHQEPMGGPLLVEHVIAYGVEILGALDYFHSHRLLYCDLKPSNVIRSANRIKIIDVGAVRGINDHRSTPEGTRRFQVSREEVTRGLTVQSDIYTVGMTLESLFTVSTDVLRPAATPDNGGVSFGIESFHRALERATHKQADRRFPSAAAMSQQLRGVLREILSLRDGEPRPEQSTIFTVTPTLLDAGLGIVPALKNWTGRSAKRDPLLDDGRPNTATVAVGLPPPHVNPEDPAAEFLASVSATDSRRLIEKLSMFQQKSVEVQLCECRAHLELADPTSARECLRRAEKILGSPADYSWCMDWHYGLLALADNDTEVAKSKFVEVYRALPGEDVPKVALGFCNEFLNDLKEAQRCYEAVWRRDRSQANAAFGLARIHMRRGNRNDAVAILDEVPDVSRHHDAARIAAVRILAKCRAVGPENRSALPTTADFSAVVRRLPDLYLDGGDTYGPARVRLVTEVREVALAWICETGGDKLLDGKEILGKPVTERGLRERLEQSYRSLTRQALNATDHGILVDLANVIRPWTTW